MTLFRKVFNGRMADRRKGEDGNPGPVHVMQNEEAEVSLNLEGGPVAGPERPKPLQQERSAPFQPEHPQSVQHETTPPLQAERPLAIAQDAAQPTPVSEAAHNLQPSPPSAPIQEKQMAGDPPAAAAPTAEIPVEEVQPKPAAFVPKSEDATARAREIAALAAKAHQQMLESGTIQSTQAQADTHGIQTTPIETHASSVGTQGDHSAAASPQTPARRGGRTRTRILGFSGGLAATADPMAKAGETQDQPTFPCGWVVVVHGPGQGQFFPVHSGVAMMGRGEDQAIRLDFGDTAISRSNHAAIAFDPEDTKFYLGHGGKSNIVRLNGRPVLTTEELSSGDSILIGETTLRFVALCGPEFNWLDVAND